MDENAIPKLAERLAMSAARLQKAEERGTAGQFALEVLHDIRNPLEALGNLVYLATEEAGDPSKVRLHMAQAEEQLAILQQIATQTLGFVSASHSPLQVDLSGVGKAAIRIHQQKIEDKQIHLVKDLPERLVARVHGGQILQVISNLIVNAVDSLPAQGTLKIRLRKRPGKIHLVVADNGHGIPREHVSLIFEPFFSTKGERGTGLGLALSKTIVERHQGGIRVRSSVRPGKSGTIFRVSLPG